MVASVLLVTTSCGVDMTLMFSFPASACSVANLSSGLRSLNREKVKPLGPPDDGGLMKSPPAERPVPLPPPTALKFTPNSLLSERVISATRICSSTWAGTTSRRSSMALTMA